MAPTVYPITTLEPVDIVTTQGPHTLRLSTASRETASRPNEDRLFLHKFSEGLLVGVLDGHFSAELSAFAAVHFPPLVAERIQSRGTDTVETAIIAAFKSFDDSLFERAYAPFANADWKQYEPGNMTWALGPKSDPSLDSNFNAARRAVVGSCALVGYFSVTGHLYVASLGDSEAAHGRLSPEDDWLVHSLNELHNCENPQELRRIEREHPGEQNVVYGGAVLGALRVTRALGDFLYKADPHFCYHVLMHAYPSPPMWSDPVTNLPAVARQATPPYILGVPTIQSLALKHGDVVVFASDGLGAHDSLWQLTQDDRAAATIKLAAGGSTAQDVIVALFGDSFPKDDVTVIVVKVEA